MKTSARAPFGVVGTVLTILAPVLLVAGAIATHAGRLIEGDVLLGAAVLVAAVAVWSVFRARARDVREITRLRALARRRSDQVSMLSHEIRTPLGVILGSAELLAEGSPGPMLPRQQAFVARIIDNAARMQSLAEQLLVQARLESEQFVLNARDVDVRGLMRSVTQELTPLAGAPIILHTPGAPVDAHVDPDLIRLVVSNLVMNAARSSPGSEGIEVRVHPTEDHVLISVSDGGTGMTDAQRDRLFARFASGQPLGNGTEIGLFISQQLIELHGGRIFVDTITGKGTTMMFTVPAAVSRG